MDTDHKPTLDDVLTAAGRIADAAGAIVGEDLSFTALPCNIFELSYLLRELKDAVNQYNAIILARLKPSTQVE